jgi:hypothetical protein
MIGPTLYAQNGVNLDIKKEKIDYFGGMCMQEFVLTEECQIGVRGRVNHGDDGARAHVCV